MAELADAQDLGSCVHSCRFDPCYPHQIKGGTQQRAAFCLVLIMEVHGSSRAACLQDARNAAQIQPLALHCMIRGVCGAFQVLLPAPKRTGHQSVSCVFFRVCMRLAEARRSFRFRLRNADKVSKNRAPRRNSIPFPSAFGGRVWSVSSPARAFSSPTESPFLMQKKQVYGMVHHFSKTY